MVNGDNNFVLINGSAASSDLYFMPNGIAEATGIDVPVNTTPLLQVLRLTQPIPGRWGEAQSIPGYVKDPNSMNAFPLDGFGKYYVDAFFNNSVRAGYSEDPGDIINGAVRDAADDNYNSFDPWPSRTTGEVGDSDYFDAAGADVFPVEQLRRYVTPADINGTGQVRQWDGVNSATGPDLGADGWGRVEYSSYFRPPGFPGNLVPSTSVIPGLTITYRWKSNDAYPLDMVSAAATSNPSNNNVLHGFEAFRLPSLAYSTAATPPFVAQRRGRRPGRPGISRSQHDAGPHDIADLRQ